MMNRSKTFEFAIVFILVHFIFKPKLRFINQILEDNDRLQKFLKKNKTEE